MRTNSAYNMYKSSWHDTSSTRTQAVRVRITRPSHASESVGGALPAVEPNVYPEPANVRSACQQQSTNKTLSSCTWLSLAARAAPPPPRIKVFASMLLKYCIYAALAGVY